jgi:DNA invertase Pin-like site-specific DNA recombinase
MTVAEKRLRRRQTITTTAGELKARRKSRELRALLAKIARTFDFPTEHANRLARFVEIITAYRAGQRIDDIVRDYGCTKSTVLRYARVMGLPKRPKHFEVRKRNRVIRLYRLKVPVAEIARRCECSPAYVSKVAKEEGIGRYNG